MAIKLDPSRTLGCVSRSNGFTDYSVSQKDNAIFLPSLQQPYVKAASQYKTKLRNGKLPTGLKTLKSLDLINPFHGAYYYPWVLYSAGTANLDSQKAEKSEGMIHNRQPDMSFVMADSGGYQLSTNAGGLKGKYPDIARTLNNMDEDPTSIRHKILRWMEHTSDAAMILDVPTTSIENEKSFIWQNYWSLDKDDPERGMFLKCLEYTVKNNAYFIKHRIPGKTHLLNVLQGRDVQPDKTGENDIWWEIVKHFNDPGACLKDVKDAYNQAIASYPYMKKWKPAEGDDIEFDDRAFEGWAMPGNLKSDLVMLLTRLAYMKAEGYLEDDRDQPMIIHFLGISQLAAGLIYTTLQQSLRRHVNKRIMITYDASNPFYILQFREFVSGATIQSDKLAINHSYVNVKTRNPSQPWHNAMPSKFTTITQQSII